MSKNNSGPGNPKKGKSLAPNPASVDLFETEDVLAEAVTVPNSTTSETPDIVDLNDDEDEDEDDPDKSPLVTEVSKSVKASLSQVPELHPADNKPGEGAIWNYFHKRIERDNNDVLISKGAICQVINRSVGTGVKCGTFLKQPGCSTTGPRNHLKRKHPKQWTELLAIEKAKEQVKRGTKRILHDTFDKLEGETRRIIFWFESSKILKAK